MSNALALAEDAISKLTFAERVRVRQRYFSPAALRACRAQERDAALLAILLVEEWSPGATAKDMAIGVRKLLEAYRVSGWRFERGRAAPQNPRGRACHRFLTANAGQVPEVETLRKTDPIRAAAAVVEKTCGNDHDPGVQQPALLENHQDATAGIGKKHARR